MTPSKVYLALEGVLTLSPAIGPDRCCAQESRGDTLGAGIIVVFNVTHGLLTAAITAGLGY